MLPAHCLDAFQNKTLPLSDTSNQSGVASYPSQPPQIILVVLRDENKSYLQTRRDLDISYPKMSQGKEMPRVLISWNSLFGTPFQLLNLIRGSRSCCSWKFLPETFFETCLYTDFDDINVMEEVGKNNSVKR